MIKALFVDRGGTLAAVFEATRSVSHYRQIATPWMRPTAVSDSPAPYYLAWPPQRKRFSSSVRCRSVRPPSVFE
jgi:hypothetical protein